ncbi:(2Fe-2S)-binding protein [Paenibacillaceae bacterium]|nr:(2Fe-2S)-binding protein [Paenibacillaceae bacterium]
MLELTGRTKQAIVTPEPGLTILDHALKHDVDWAFSCSRGTCARCRCHIAAGMDSLEEVTDEEWDRLDEEELDEGFRLGCQAVVKDKDATIVAFNKPYF